MSRMSVHTLQRALFCAFNFRPDIPSCHHLRIKEIPQCVTVVLPQCHPPSLSVIAESPMTSLSARVILRRRVAIDVTWLAGHFRSVWPDDWRSRDPSAKAKVWHYWQCERRRDDMTSFMTSVWRCLRNPLFPVPASHLPHRQHHLIISRNAGLLCHRQPVF